VVRKALKEELEGLSYEVFAEEVYSSPEGWSSSSSVRCGVEFVF